MRIIDITTNAELKDPGWYRAVFAGTAMAPVWLLLRVYIGWQWLQAGWHKVYSEETGFAGADTYLGDGGASLRAFWERIVTVPEPPARTAISYEWYRDFIQFMLDRGWHEWFTYVIAIGEVAIGVALIVGLFTGLAAIGGASMNFNFMLAGSASSNPILFLGAILLLLGWKVVGYIGIDRWLLPALGTPWSPGTVLHLRRRPAPTGTRAAA